MFGGLCPVDSTDFDKIWYRDKLDLEERHSRKKVKRSIKRPDKFYHRAQKNAWHFIVRFIVLVNIEMNTTLFAGNPNKIKTFHAIWFL
jgi:hypothetical protein